MLLKEINDLNPVVDRSPIKGLIVAKTTLNPLDAIELLRTRLYERNDSFRVILRVLPIEKIVKSHLDEIVKASTSLSIKIGIEDSFRVTFEKRRTSLRSREVIDAVAQNIKRKVELENPDWIVLIEVIGMISGISVIPQKGILNIQKERALLLSKRQQSSSL
jgi:tRNA acetyltransferase TAN1